MLFGVFGADNAFGDVILSPNVVVPNACVFDNTGVYESMFEMIPVYEDTIYTCERGYYLPKLSEECIQCPEISYCPGGKYTYSENYDTGINTCPDGLVAPNSMWELAQCGRLFHVEDSVLYLRTVKQTTPSFAFDVNADGIADYWANMTVGNVPISRGAARHLYV